MDYKAIGKKIISLVGGTENIRQLTHCATRLRFEFYKKEKVDVKSIENIPGVIGVVEKGGQFQVIIGNEVQTAFRAISEEMKHSEENDGNRELDREEKTTIVNRIISVISTTFTPVIPALIGGGMIKAVLSILVLAKLVDPSESTYSILTFISDAPFYFMPVLLAYGAAMKFKCNPILAITMACALLHPSWNGMVEAGESITFFGIPVVLVNYSSSVVPIILSVWIMSYVERFAEKYSPSVIKFFLKPLLIMFIAIPIALLGVGPFGNLLNDIVQTGATVLNEKVSWLIPMLMGAFQPFLTLTGTAWAMTPIATGQISSLGYEVVNGPGMLASNIAQGGATLAVAFKTKNKELKQMAASSGFTAVMGITEPCLYGVLLKLKRPLIASMIGGAAGGIYAGISGLVRYAFVSPGLTAIPAFIGENPWNVVHALITIVISFVVGFAASWLLGFQESTEVEGTSKKDGVSGEWIKAPVTGRAAELSEVAEVLIHVGIDTVNLQGKYFTPKVKAGSRVEAGELLLEFDLQAIAEEGYDTVIPIIVTNTPNYRDVELTTCGQKKAGENLLGLV